MSEDNYTYCPKCYEKRRKWIDKKSAEANEKYGKIPIRDWRDMDRHIDYLIEEKNNRKSLREGFAIGMSSGRFSVLYRAECKDCSFTFNFEKTVTDIDTSITE